MSYRKLRHSIVNITKCSIQPVFVTVWWWPSPQDGHAGSVRDARAAAHGRSADGAAASRRHGRRLPCPTVPGQFWVPPTLSNSSRSVVGAANPVQQFQVSCGRRLPCSRSVVGAAYPVQQFQVSCGRRLPCPTVPGQLWAPLILSISYR